MKLPAVILTTPPEFNRTEILMNTEPPYVIAKVVKFSDNPGAAEDYEIKIKMVDYFITKIEGYNIFVTHAGYLGTPLGYVDEKTIAYTITEMAEWYRLNILSKKRAGHLKTLITKSKSKK